jgi:DNA polymerase I-like protein with 3'-5' exonuclease and polymerase domains
LLVHYATLLDLPGAEKMAVAYRENPDTDFHQMVADLAGIKRKAAKTIGLGLMYGMGKAKLANSLDLPLDEASELIATFHQKVPFLKGTVNAVMKRIEHPAAGGAIRTLLGRKCRFPLWEPMEWGVNKALPREQAVIEYGQRIKRAGTYKGLNRLIQGSAADQTKAGMVALHKAGFKLLLQVHDEVVISVKTREEAGEAARIMATCVNLEVPSRCDVEVGPNWGEAK